jgi:hypothetical protein
MGALRQVRINYLDREPVEVSLPPKVQIQFEEHFDMSLAEMKRASHMYWLAWAAATHAGLESTEYDAFLDLIVDVEPVQTEVTVNGDRPTLVAQ